MIVHSARLQTAGPLISALTLLQPITVKEASRLPTPIAVCYIRPEDIAL
jgi:hypothetical protein